jgi:hypothetical protein
MCTLWICYFLYLKKQGNSDFSKLFTNNSKEITLVH